MGTRKTKIEKKLEKGSEVIHTIKSNRGSIIEFASDIENDLSDIITWCFYPGKYNVKLSSHEQLTENGIIFKSIILNKLDFRDKIEILKDVILNKNPDIWDNYSHLIKETTANLNKVREFRNLMAHASSDLSDKFLKSINLNTYKRSKEFQILEYKKGKLIKHKFTQNDIDFKMLMMARTKLGLLQLFALINKDYESFTEYKEVSNIIPS